MNQINIEHWHRAIFGAHWMIHCFNDFVWNLIKLFFIECHSLHHHHHHHWNNCCRWCRFFIWIIEWDLSIYKLNKWFRFLLFTNFKRFSWTDCMYMPFIYFSDSKQYNTKPNLLFNEPNRWIGRCFFPFSFNWT